MRNFLTTAMGVTLALCLATATLAYGAVTLRLAGPVFGLGLVLALLWAVELVTSETAAWKYSPMHLPIAGFLLYAVARYFTSPIEHVSRIELFNICLYGLIYFLAASNFSRPRDRTILIVTLIALAFIESSYGLWQFATKAKTVLFDTRPVQYQHRAGGTFFCPNHLAGFLEVVLGLLVARFAIYRSAQDSVQLNAIKKVALGYAALMVMAGIITSLSRAGWIAATASLVSFLFWGEWRPRTLLVRASVVILAVGLLGVLAVQMNPVRDYVSLTFKAPEEGKQGELQDTSLGGRKEMWGSTLKIIRDHPVWGTGPATWQWFHLKYRDPRTVMHPEFAHSDVLNVTSDYGLVGLVLVVAILACFYRHVIVLMDPANSSELRSFAIGSAMGVTAILIHSFFDFNMHIRANALLVVTIMGFTAAMEDSQKRFRKIPLKPPMKFGLAGFLLLFCLAGGWFAGSVFMADRDIYKGNNSRLELHLDHALAHFQRATEVDPRNPIPYARLGDIYQIRATFQVGTNRLAERQRLALKSTAFYKQSVVLNPYNSMVLLRMARSYEIAGDNDSALKTYQMALAVDPNSAFVHQRLGFFYRNIGDKPRALEHFEKSRQLNWWTDPAAPLNLEELRSEQPP